MGATTFMKVGRGVTADGAFRELVSSAQHENGHGGYTGTIAEKSEFTMIRLPEPPDDKTPAQWAAIEADRLIEEDDPRISDKWGPAGCFDLGDGSYLFFGWASE